MGVFSDPLRFPEEAQPDTELDKAVRIVCSRPWKLEEAQRNRLCEALEVDSRRNSGDSIDIAEEVRRQCALVRALRSQFMDSDGRLHPGIDIKEAQSAVSSFNSFLNAYLKAEEKVDRFERLRKIEESVVSMVKTLPESMQETFFKDLEAKLEEKTFDKT